jgi:vacuolar-type H+-ATPase subunit I/STV1
MKKYIISLILIVLIIPSVALASWWNPLSWFNNWTFHKQEITQEIKEMSNQSIEPIKKETRADNPLVKDEKPKKEIVEPQKQTNNNIVNTKTETPLINNTNLIDLCPNLGGIQSVIPLGKFIYKNNGECLTNQEIDILELKISQEKNERDDILSQLAEINGFKNYYSDLSLEELKNLLKTETERERNEILSGFNKEDSYRYYYSDLSNDELKEIIRIEKNKQSCLSNNSSSSGFSYTYSENNDSCSKELKSGYYIGCCGSAIKGTEPSNLNCGGMACA